MHLDLMTKSCGEGVEKKPDVTFNEFILGSLECILGRPCDHMIKF